MRVKNRRLCRPTTSRTNSITDRQERIPGWRQDRLAEGRALILGAGALGNEVVKNLALMGLGYMMVADLDFVEQSNLSRAVYFRRSDARQHQSKAETVAKRARAMNVFPSAFIQPFHGDVVWQLGYGVFRRVDVVLGCLDNIEARMAANRACLISGTPYVDGGILGLAGNVTAVHPPSTPCWECTTGAVERDHSADRYDSCSKVMRLDIEAGRLPAVQIASSIIAGFQTEEAVKVILGQPWAAGFMIQWSGGGSRPDLDVVRVQRRPGCWCGKAHQTDRMVELPISARTCTLRAFFRELAGSAGHDILVHLPASFILSRHCYACHRTDPILRPSFKLDTGVLVCPACGAGADEVKLCPVESVSLFSASADDLQAQMLEMTLIDIGFAPLGLISVASQRDNPIADMVVELSSDAVSVMGDERFISVRR